jgi:amino acid transporter
MAPVPSAVVNTALARESAGAALPLAYLLAFVASLLVGNTVVQFARRFPSSGSFFTYNTLSLSPTAGFLTGWCFALGYTLFPVAAILYIGIAGRSFLQTLFGLDVSAWLLSLVAWFAVTALSLLGIKQSIRVDLSLLALGMGVMLTVVCAALWRAGAGHDWSYFFPSRSSGGAAGLGTGVIFGLLSFIGFDAAAALAEETNEPRRNVPRAILGALTVVGVFYVVSLYALAAGYGLNQPGHLPCFLEDENPFRTIAASYVPPMVPLLEFCLVAGNFSSSLAANDTTARVIYAMGRDRVLPEWLGHAHPRWGSPVRATTGLSLFTLGITLGLGLSLGPGLNGAIGFAGTLGTASVIVVYLASNIALLRYNLGKKEHRWLIHCVFPALGAVLLLFPLWALMAATDGASQSYSSRAVPLTLLVWLAAGGVFSVYSRRRASRQREASDPTKTKK